MSQETLIPFVSDEWFVEAHRRFDMYVQRAVVGKPKNGREDIGDCLLSTGALNDKGYSRIKICGKQYGLHRLSLILWTSNVGEGFEAAHSCHNPACFEPTHLSWKTMTQNQEDRLRDGTHNRGLMKTFKCCKTSKHIGVSFDKCKNKWRAGIKIKGKDKKLGYFHTQEEAALAYDAEARTINATLENPNSHYRLNFPDSSPP